MITFGLGCVFSVDIWYRILLLSSILVASQMLWLESAHFRKIRKSRDNWMYPHMLYFVNDFRRMHKVTSESSRPRKTVTNINIWSATICDEYKLIVILVPSKKDKQGSQGVLVSIRRVDQEETVVGMIEHHQAFWRYYSTFIGTKE